jgi:hypothetical protein
MDSRKMQCVDQLSNRAIDNGVEIPQQLELDLRTEQDKRYTLMKKFEETRHNKSFLDNDQACL